MIRRPVFRKIKENLLFRRIFITYALFIIAVFMLTSLFSIGKSALNLRNEILKTRMEQLQRFRHQFDRLLPQWVSTELSETFVSNKRDIGKMSAWETNSSLLKVRDASAEMKKIVTATPHLRDISFYLLQSDTFLSQFYGLNLKMTQMRPYPVYRDYIPFLRKLSGSDGSLNGWVRWESRGRGEHPVNIPTLTFYQGLPVGGTQRTGLIAYHFDIQVLERTIGPELTEGSEFTIYNRDIPLFGPSITEEAPNFPDQPSGTFFSGGSKGKKVVLWARSRSNDFIYVYQVPIEQLKSQVIQSIWIAAVATVLIFLFALFAIGRLTSYYYGPLGSLFQTVKNWAGREGMKLNLESAQRYLQEKDRSFTKMREALSHNREINRYNLFLAVLFGRLKSENSLADAEKLAGIHFRDGRAGLLVVEIETPVFGRQAVEIQELIIHEIRGAIDIFFERKDVPCLAYSHRRSTVPVLFSPTSLTDKELKDLLGEFGEIAPVNICLGTFSLPLGQIQQVYERCREYSLYSFIYPSGRIFSNELISEWETRHIDFHTKQMNEIKEMIKSSGSDTYFKTFEESLSRYLEEGVSLVSLKNCLLQNALLLGELALEYNIQEPSLNSSRLEVESMGQTTLELWSRWFRCRLSTYKQEKEKKFKAGHSLFIESVKRHINENLDSQMSLETVADHFDVSPGHLSRLFKEYSNLCFGEYLKKQKIVTAAAILRRSPDEEIARIAARLGYHTPSYFSRIFKEAYGMTPAKYRKVEGERRETTVPRHTVSG